MEPKEVYLLIAEDNDRDIMQARMIAHCINGGVLLTRTEKEAEQCRPPLMIF